MRGRCQVLSRRSGLCLAALTAGLLATSPPRPTAPSGTPPSETSPARGFATLPPELAPLVIATLQQQAGEEYAVRPIDDFSPGARFRGANPAHGFQATFDADGVSVAFAGTDAPTDPTWALRLTRYGTDGAMEALAPGAATHAGPRIE
jgi:hypothetical protein